jgi:murein DD-endopeptidase MepM/ murein hydrolase activator NlpD
MRRLPLLAAVIAIAALGAVARAAPASPSCVAASDRAYAYQQQKRHSAKQLRTLERVALACASGRQQVGFWPQGGRLDHDLYLTNTVDLVEGGLRDPWCGSRTYDGHTGEDVIIRSFREQAAGVPVFAAIDGRVTQVQEGAKDTNYGNQTLPWDNHVQIDSGRDQMAIYGHLRRGSVRVKVGDWVVAGQQIGLTGSSGNSSWPHLHFTLIVDSQPVDLWSGPCNPTGYWESQPELRTDAFARDFALAGRPFAGHDALPWDEAKRSASFRPGTRDLWFRSMLLNAEDARSQTVRVVRPDGTAARETTSAPSWQRFRQAEAVWHERIGLDSVGTWRIQIDVDGERLLDEPFEVRDAAVANRAPAAVSVRRLRTAGGVWVCQVDSDLLHADPDLDLVSYRYAWRVGGKLVRSLRAGGLQDALPRTTVGAPTCSVTPTDGSLDGPTATA